MGNAAHLEHPPPFYVTVLARVVDGLLSTRVPPLRSPKVQATADGAPGPGGLQLPRPSPCPLPAQSWYQELRARKRDGSITSPTVLTVLAAAPTKARASANP